MPGARAEAAPRPPQNQLETISKTVKWNKKKILKQILAILWMQILTISLTNQ